MEQYLRLAHLCRAAVEDIQIEAWRYGKALLLDIRGGGHVQGESVAPFYTKDDIQLIKQIFFLVNEQGLKLEGARKKLGEKKDQVAKQQEIAERLRRVKKELQGIARFLMEE